MESEDTDVLGGARLRHVKQISMSLESDTAAVTVSNLNTLSCTISADT